MEGWFASLNSLKVSDCESVEVIFEIKDSQQVDASGGIDTNLQVVDVWGLPMLEQVWSRDPGGILNFKKLQSIEMENCKRLRNVFPASVAKDVPKLEYMSVSGCDGIVEIVACEDGSETNTEQLVFPELTYMALYDLRSIQHFYRGRHPIECPKLKKLSVGKCNKKLKTFGTGERSNEEDEAVMSAEKIFPNLEFLDIHFDEAQKWLLSNTVKHRMHRLKELWLSEVNDGERLCQILYRMPNLEKLYLREAEHLLKESSESRLGTVLQLKELDLWYSETKDIGFEREPVLQRLELLSIVICNKLRNLAPPWVSLAYLTNLKVEDCNGLRNLMASSTAKSLVQLKSMKISGCYRLEEIVTNKGNEEAEQIVFGKLITIELERLKKLKSFCSYKNCDFKFPSLEVLIVRECPLMHTFTEGDARAPKLQNKVTAKEEGKEEAKWQEGDLNATVQEGFNKLLESASTESSLSLRDSPLQVIWLDSRRIPTSCFSNLNSLTVDGCQFLTDVVIPFYLLPFLTNLEKLQVRNCGSVKSIFDVKTAMGLGAAAFPRPLPFSLKKLTLERLPKLENVWNEDPHGILTMQLLQHVIVAEDNADPRQANLELTFPCPCVRSLNLQGLPKFKYFYYYSLQCDMFQTPTEDEMPTSNLQCLSLGEKGLEMIKRGEFQRNFLHKLQVLTLCFRNGSNVFPYEILQLAPNIEKLVVCDGSFKEIFCFDSLNVDEAGLLLQLKVLCLDSLPELVSIGLENSWIQPSLGNLETLEVIGCSSLKDLFTSSTARSLTRLKRMEIKWCGSIEEVVSKEGNESHENEIIFPQLNCLKLEGLEKLRSFYKGSLLSFPSLEELSVIRCEWMETLCPGTLKADKLVQVQLEKSYSWRHSDPIKLENDLNSTMREAFREKLWHSARSVPYIDLKDSPLQEIWLRLHSLHIPPHFCFTYLHTFIVDGCHFLSDAVLPFSLLPLLPNLKTLKVRNCDFVKIIFDVITMEPLPFALENLILERLPNLENVWNSNVELTFPQVKSSALCDLPKLKYDMLKPFTHLEPHTLNQVSIQKLTPNIEHLTLGQHELNMILSGEFQGNHLNELKVLALFFHIESDVFLQRVPNIEKLEVRDGSFKEIFCFDSLNVDEDGLVSQLKVICSDSLPELVSIGSENSGIVPFLRNLETLEVISCLSSINLVPCTVYFSNLTYLQVQYCNSLLYLFTSSTARSLGQLKTMKISNCGSIEEIVSSTEEGDESDENEIIFQQLNCLKLKYLGKLRRFYKGSLSFPSLEEFTVRDCERMESLCAGTVKTDKLLEVNINGDDIPLETDLNSAIQNR
ncbi:hypothetical protein D0Y65_017080 [Glycine soja]|uniref:Disease resistance protein At4g27190-like leucine-rich repeats domain-containing protein n=1 Tax=Glycine soja TaxID=3848 RepID=A0A445JT92_GLYSO|nr:hypothetical protein D0Y65_017080 [Glycine soja]RZC01715.1 hypothetical protein D0Y65_017080 [Glycine soja]